MSSTKDNTQVQGPRISLAAAPFLGESITAARTSRSAGRSIPVGAGAHLSRPLGVTESVAPIEVWDHEPAQLAEAPKVSTAVNEAPAVPQERRLQAQWWQTIDLLRSRVAERQAEELQGRIAASSQERETIGQRHINDVVNEHMRDQITRTGRDGRWSSSEQQAAVKAIFDQMFRLGRFQVMIDEPDVENIHVNGCDQVFVERAGGIWEPRPPVAESDDQLMADLQFLAQNAGESARPFSAAQPDLDMDLMGSVRLAALAPPISERPSAVFRIHRFVDISLEQMVEAGNLSRSAAEFLTACIRAGKTIVIAGFGGAGKTTLMRALAGEIGKHEQIVTIEKERELHLHRLSGRDLKPFALQYRPGSGERTASGLQVGEYTLEKAMEKALRLNSQRILVGEVRGPEITAMLQAMQTGAGTFCTTHAFDPDDAIDRLAGLGMSRFSEGYMARQLGHHLDLVVQIEKRMQPNGRSKRQITWISEVQPSEGDRKVTTKPLFELHGLAEHARPVSPPSDRRLRADLEAVGYDLSAFGGTR